MKIRSIIKGKESNNAPLKNDAVETAKILQEDTAQSAKNDKTQKKQKKEPKTSQASMKGKNKVFYVVSILSVFLILLLLLYFCTLLAGLTPHFEINANQNALKELDTTHAAVRDRFEKHFTDLEEIAAKLDFAGSKADVDGTMRSYVGSEQFGTLRYFSHGIEYTCDGYTTLGDNDQFLELAQQQDRGVSDVYFYGAVGMDCIALYVPVKGSAFIDGVLSVLPARQLIDLSDLLRGNCSVLALIDDAGMVLGEAHQEGFQESIGNHYFDFIKSLTENKRDYDNVAQMVSEARPTSAKFMIGGTPYTLATRPVEGSGDKLYIAELTVSRELTASEMSYIRQIIVMSIVSVVALLISIGFVFRYHRKATQKLIRSTQIAPELGCDNAAQFRKRCNQIASETKHQKLMVVCIEVRQFSYISGQLGEDATLEILKYIVKILTGLCGQFETFGYAEDGVFLLMLRCNKESEFDKKIGVLNSLASKNEVMKKSGMTLGFYIGACAINRSRNRSIGDLVENATLARNMAKSEMQKPYIIYTDDINDNLRRNDEIEAQMEEALRNREFKLFLQPKYGIKRDAVDSAEALVRWFDTRKNAYVFPGEFIPLFESNGFITKLDHYMYLEVCEYFKNATEHGDKVVPVSVNVSRVTAIQQDFLEFYIGNKKRYGVADGFLTIEFTESFAMQNYDAVLEIVTQLHKNGIHCSIDDFGSGYSSFSILKSIPMDELKIDSSFLQKGLSQERDDLIIRTVISMAKQMGMVVVQEGVETKDVFDRIVAMGCDVIQGYYYARAIPLEEYRLFINTNTSIKYKAKVK